MRAMNKNSILIIDDERDNISSLKTMLSPEYTIYASTNGKDAIDTAEKFLPDVILLDVVMPDMDGYEVLSALKASEKTRDIPVIFITGLDNIDAEIKGLALGAADYIIKPFHQAIVKLRIKNNIMLVERLHQESLITKIAHNFLAGADPDTLHTGTLQMVGEFMGIATLHLYKMEKNSNVFVCSNEWINPATTQETRIGDKIEFNDKIIFAINNLLGGSQKDLFIKSKEFSYNDYIKTKRKHIENYIMTPIFIKGSLYATLVFSKDNDNDWSEIEKDLAVLVSSIFSVVFERDAIQRMEYLSTAKSEFLSRMSHEMRTPMNAIIGMLQVLEISGIPDNIKEHCDIMNASAHSLLRMIENVLDISDVEYGSLKLSDSVFDFRLMLKEILLNADKIASRKQQMLNCTTDPDIPPSLSGDEKRLKQVISNLFANAVKFTPENGEINFDTKAIKEENGIVTLQFEISDNGIGISKEQQNNIFSMFEQADSGNNREYDGIGTGLAFSKRLVELMGGNIWVESELGKGSNFKFTCKLKKAN
ncbi:MAG: ATP-binding protein [Treponema sp.]|nr:ATP-binding protein [Treponema sp.]